MKKPLIIASFLIIVLSSCGNLEKQLEGTWAIDNAYVNNKPVVWNLIGNAIGLEKSMKCNLPIINMEDRHSAKETGTWKISKVNDIAYLHISTTNEFFNRTFEIRSLKRVQDPISFGYLLKMTLLSDSLKLDCTKALY